MVDIHAAMQRLARVRPVFHSEADFKHALAWTLQEGSPTLRVRLEYRPFPDERAYVDIWLRDGSTQVALELKYWTRRIRLTFEGELFTLADQAAQDMARYDAVKDIQCLERCVRELPDTEGWAVWLTNDSAYWTPPKIAQPIDAAFRIHEGRTLTGSLAWSPRAGTGTTKGRNHPLVLRGVYVIRWHDYSNVGSGPYSAFRYAAVRVGADLGRPGVETA